MTSSAATRARSVPLPVKVDLVVVGSGAAGLSAALKAAELGARVVVLTAGALLAGSSPRAQGGVAGALGADDSPALHAADTLAVGGGLNDRAAVAVLTAEGEPSLHRLITRGVPFDRDLGLEAGHARRRILHAGGAATGHVLSSALLEQATTQPGITLFAQTRADALLKQNGRVVGVRSGARTFHASATLLATGGYAALWGRTTNAPENRGTGLILAYLAGASLADLEFVQFHPTALSIPGQPAFLLSEALRGEGALLVDASGREVVDPLLPRDVVARALHQHLRAHGPVFLSLRHLDAAHVRQRFPSLVQRLDEFGLDLARDLLPVSPAAHYCMGGIRTDTWGRTDVPGLFAAGEVACTGAQGANRLASNSLLECLVFGARAAEAALLPYAERALRRDDDTAAYSADRPDPAAEDPSRAADRPPSDSHSAAARGLDALTSLPTWRTRDLPELAPLPAAASERVTVMDPAALGALLDADLGVERSAHRLARLAATLSDLATSEDGTTYGYCHAHSDTDQARSIYGYGPAHSDTDQTHSNTSFGSARAADASPEVRLAALIARAAFLRLESRGAHFRTDFPDTSPAWRGRIHFRAGSAPRFEEVQPR